MFETAVVNNGPTGKRVWAACLGMTGQALFVGLAVLVPMIFPEALPVRTLSEILFTPTAPPPPHVTVVPVPDMHPTVAPPKFNTHLVSMPTSVPMGVDTRPDPPEMFNPVGVANGTGPAIPDGAYTLMGDFLNRTARILIPTAPVERAVAPAPVAAPAAKPTQRVVVGGLVKMAVRTHYVAPVYPVLARNTRIEGVVRLEGVIGVDGRIRELNIVEGHPLLTKAALDAVKQWIYEPTTLNGDPVEVVAPITVTFRLN